MKILTILLLGTLAASAAPKKNVLLIMADDFNHWLPAIGYYPDAKTPNLDRLAKKGVLFTRAYSASPVCNPSRNAIWSGYRPHTTGIQGNQDGYIRTTKGFENAATMNQYFTENGYHTLGAGKLYHAGRMGGPTTDPAHWSQLYKGATGSPGGRDIKYKNPNSTVIYNFGEFDIEKAGDTAMARFVADFLDKRPAEEDKPFFIGCGFFRPHLPWNCHKKFWDLYKTGDIKLPQGYKEGDLDDVAIHGNEEGTHAQLVKDGKWKEAIHAYLANLSYADFNVGIVLDALEKSPHKDNTIVLFMGDHGWHLGEKDRWSKHAVFEQANHTTFIVYDPSASGNGKSCPTPVCLQDIYPTLIDLCGLPPNPKVEGESLKPLLKNPLSKEWNHPVFISYNGTHSIRTDDWTLIELGDKTQLYHTAKDPHEWDNLYGNPEYAGIAAKLRNSMKSIMTKSDKAHP